MNFFEKFLKIFTARCTTGVVDAGGNLPPVSLTPAVPVAKFAARVVDTGGAP
jgi:hypothetical protein